MRRKSAINNKENKNSRGIDNPKRKFSCMSKIPLEINFDNKRVNTNKDTGKDKLTKKITKHVCPICLDEIVYRATIQNCSHFFCKLCIQKWAKMSNTCPQCRDKFTLITYLNSGKIVYEKIIDKEYKCEGDSFLQDNSDDYCMECRSDTNPHQLLICDECDLFVCHTYCDGLDDVPEGDWICRVCRKKDE